VALEDRLQGLDLVEVAAVVRVGGEQEVAVDPLLAAWGCGEQVVDPQPEPMGEVALELERLGEPACPVRAR
jgi:hypothetical protein